MPSERGETEEEKEEYAVLKKEWEVYDAIPKMIKIRKEKGAAAKVSYNYPTLRSIFLSSYFSTDEDRDTSEGYQLIGRD